MRTAIKILYLCTMIILFGCFSQQNKKNDSKITVITGNIKNLEVYPNTKEFSVQIVDFRGKETIITDTIKSDGTFKVEFELYTAQDIKIEPIVGKIIAHPGDSIHINIDFKDIGNVKFAADGQKSNQELYKYLNSNYSLDEFQNRRFNKFDFMYHKLFCDSVRNVLINKRVEFINGISPTAEVLKWTIEYINIKYYESLLIFPFQFLHNKKEYEDNPPPKDYYNFLDSIGTVFNSKLINTDAYKLPGLYRVTNLFRIAKDTSLSRESIETILLKEIIEKRKDDIFKQVLIGNSFYENLNENNLEYFEKHKTILDANIHESFIRIPLIYYYQNIKKAIENPQIASDAILKKMVNTAGKDLLDSILTVNKGKVIYIDCWATWCGPCKAEMPNSRKLMQKYAGKKIEFVYICLDSKEDVWKLNLAQLQLSGQHYFCNKEQSGSIRKGLNIDGIPHYVLINKQGQITEFGSYLRPGGPETIKKIDKLLNE